MRSQEARRALQSRVRTAIALIPSTDADFQHAWRHVATMSRYQYCCCLTYHHVLHNPRPQNCKSKMKSVVASALILAPLAGAFTVAPSAQNAAVASRTALNAAPKKKGPAMIKSKSLPFAECPAALDGSMAGDVGFDPLCFSADESKLFNYREAEIKHARLAMLAAAGWPLSELFDKKLASALHWAPLVDDANRAPALLNGGLGKVSPAYWAAVILMASAIDAYGLTKVNEKDYTPGDLKFDPLGLMKINPQWMATAEIKNGRLAMVAITGFAAQEFVSGNAAFSAL